MDESVVTDEEALGDVLLFVELSGLCGKLVGLSTFKYTGMIGTEIFKILYNNHKHIKVDFQSILHRFSPELFVSLT